MIYYILSIDPPIMAHAQTTTKGRKWHFSTDTIGTGQSVLISEVVVLYAKTNFGTLKLLLIL